VCVVFDGRRAVVVVVTAARRARSSPDELSLFPEKDRVGFAVV
jgi:hypothetical protein